MKIPEINSVHSEVIKFQSKRLKTKRGFISTKSNCSIQSYVPAISPLMEYNSTKILACTYQAISGSDKTFNNRLQIIGNTVPYIDDEESNSELERLKIWEILNMVK
ncbi:MAG: hypothetical protein ACRC42_02010 [Mycoplasma sp.]